MHDFSNEKNNIVFSEMDFILFCDATVFLNFVYYVHFHKLKYSITYFLESAYSHYLFYFYYALLHTQIKKMHYGPVVFFRPSARLFLCSHVHSVGVGLSSIWWNHSIGPNPVCLDSILSQSASFFSSD